MKKLYNLAALQILFSISIICNAQTSFWTEGFGKGCNQGQRANGVVTGNGTWVVKETGVNDDQANVWYISARADGTGAENCADNNCSSNNQTLHISSNDGISTNDNGCNYNAGGLCSSFSICVTTNTMAVSPSIYAVGYSGITLSFNYISYGQPGLDFASVYL